MKARTRTVTVVLMSVVLLLLVANVAYAHDWWLWHWHKRTLGILIFGPNSVSTAAARADWDAPFNVMNTPRVFHHSDVSAFDANFGYTDWGGLASIESWTVHFHCWFIFCYPNPGAIVHAHARLNTYWFWSGLGTGTVFDAGRGVQCQEIGHTFGLDHSPDGCMGKGYFAGLSANEPISNVVVGHSDTDLNNKYGGAPLGTCSGGC